MGICAHSTRNVDFYVDVHITLSVLTVTLDRAKSISDTGIQIHDGKTNLSMRKVLDGEGTF